MDVSEVLGDYLASIKHLAKGTQRLYQMHLSVFAEWCTGQGVEMEQINNRNVHAFLEWLRVNRKPKKRGQTEISTHTLADYVRSILAFLHWCLSDEEYSQYLKLQTVKNIKMPRVEQLVKPVFSDEEITALFNACQSPEKTHEYQLRDTAILALLLDCGLRAAELRTLTIGNVTLARDLKEDSYITVHGKGNKWREIPLGNKARRALSRYMRQYRKGATKQETVFLSRYGGEMAHGTLKDMLLRLATCAGVNDCHPHKFRHSFATRFMASGGDVYDLSKLMGHSSVAITEGYLKSLSAQAIRTRKNHRSVLDEL
jgi:integrase/recombinase XerD